MTEKPDVQARASLARVMHDTELFAMRAMQDFGCITARLYIHGEHGTETLLMKSGESLLSKRQFATFARIACVAVGADATVFVSEAWMFNAILGEPPALPGQTKKGLDSKEVVIEAAVRPDAKLIKKAQNPKLEFEEQVAMLQNRREVVILMGEAVGYGEQRLMPILRSRDGKFLSLGNTEKLAGNQFRGEFLNFVSQACRDPKQQAIARHLLAKHGISFGKQPDQLKMREERRRRM